jgi:hypothetical protein
MCWGLGCVSDEAPAQCRLTDHQQQLQSLKLFDLLDKLIMMKSNLLNICFVRAVALPLIASLHLTAIAQTSNNQPGSQSPPVSSANRIASPIKTWPEPGSPMELLPKIEFQSLTDEDMQAALEKQNREEGQAKGSTWRDVKQKNCLTQFWIKKPVANERPFMLTTHTGLAGFIKLNGFVARARSTGGDKLGGINDYGKGELDSFFIKPNHQFDIGTRYLRFELRKATQKSCSFLNSHCKIYTAEAYVYWTSREETASPPEGPREELRSVYIEDRCVNNEYKTQLFDHRAKPSLLDRLVGLFFSKS